MNLSKIKSKTPYKMKIYDADESVEVSWADRSITVKTDADMNDNKAIGIYITRPSDGLTLNQTVGHQITEGHSITSFGLTPQAVGALGVAISFYLDAFGSEDKKTAEGHTGRSAVN